MKILDLDKIKDLRNAKYELGGEGPTYDWYTFIKEIYKRHNLFLPEKLSIYNFKERSKRLNEHKILFERIEKPRAFAIVGLKYRKKLLTHMGICIDDKRFLELNSKQGVVICKIQDNLKYIEGYYIYKNQENKCD